MSHAGLSVAEEARKRFVARATRLREQEGNRRAAAASLGLYVRRWATSATERVSPLGRLRGMTRRLVAGAY